VTEVTLPPSFDAMSDAHTTIMETEGAAAFLDLNLGAAQAMSARMLERHAPALLDSPARLKRAYRMAERCRSELDQVFEDYDVLVTPAAPGEAPAGHASTGSAIFNAMWSLLHVPCVAVPCTLGPSGLPVGVQLIGAEHDDARLLRIAAMLAPVIDAERIGSPRR